MSLEPPAHGFSRDMVDVMPKDAKRSIDDLTAHAPTMPQAAETATTFTHDAVAAKG